MDCRISKTGVSINRSYSSSGGIFVVVFCDSSKVIDKSFVIPFNSQRVVSRYAFQHSLLSFL